MKKPNFAAGVLAAAAAIACAGASAETFSTDYFTGSFDSTLSLGTGIRTKAPSGALIIEGNQGGPAGQLAITSAMGDQGDLNYAKNDAFTRYLKGSHELLLKFPENFTAMARVSWLRDFAATRTTGWTSATTPPGLDGNLADDARSDLKFKARLLDLWVSKKFEIGDQSVRVRAGNQVISWGESLFVPGGINVTNAVDVMRLSQPGTQIKEAILPAPIISAATGLGNGLNAEAYVQLGWNANYMPPTGSYWSVSNGLGAGHDSYGLQEDKARNSGQWGVSLRYQPQGTQLNLGAYVINYHDKSPTFTFNNPDGAMGWVYGEDRKLYGLSANFPLGDWAIGGEVSYRPKDAVTLNAANGCASQNGTCAVDSARIQMALTGLFSLSPDTSPTLLKVLGADSGTLLAEAVAIRFPNLKTQYGDDLIAAGGWGWGQEKSVAGTPLAVGTKNSSGFSFDFSWVYDGTLIPGWQVVPEVYYFRALSGRTPNGAATFMKGASSANYIVSFIQNPAKWQFAINYARFMGGDSAFDQPYRDRDFIGLNLSRNF
ncbi:DUF1302 domain-containing protein [Paucibacter sp. KCTC 42545]|uniref:DUF1302 domain-containing protein n=1 Tax=Paucibacter sp. KCTC 42545 TaxID=1768242 RepID=UPI000A408D51|nr:DUF1302 domain-containing protein [Paucibacter sp. KCTC 42545]